MSETSIGGNSPLFGPKVPKDRDPRGQENAKTSDTNSREFAGPEETNLNKNPAFLGGKSQVRPSTAPKGYVGNPADTEKDLETFQLLAETVLNDEVVAQVAQKNGIPQDVAREHLLNALTDLQELPENV